VNVTYIKAGLKPCESVIAVYTHYIYKTIKTIMLPIVIIIIIIIVIMPSYLRAVVHPGQQWLALQRRRQNWIRSPSIRTSLLASTLFPSSPRRPAYGVSRQWAWWRSLDDGWRKSTRSHTIRRSCVSACRSLFSAETLPVFIGTLRPVVGGSY